MKKTVLYRIVPMFIVYGLGLLLLASCSSSKPIVQIPKDTIAPQSGGFIDALRIRGSDRQKFEADMPNRLSDGRTLYGFAYYWRIDTIATDANEMRRVDTVIAFRDRVSTSRGDTMFIPLRYLESVEEMFGIRNTRDSLFIESMHEVGQIPLVRAIPRKGAIKPVTRIPLSASKPCDCEEFTMSAWLKPYLDLGVDVDFAAYLNCKGRTYDWYFAEIRGTYSSFTDRISPTQTVGSDAFGAEVAAGFRFGAKQEWGVGMAFTSPMIINSVLYENATQNGYIEVSRPVALLHVRYQFGGGKSGKIQRLEAERRNGISSESTAGADPATDDSELFGMQLFGTCVRPFVFGQIGVALDAATRNALNFNLNPDCNDCTRYVNNLQSNGQIDFNMGLPITYGFGAGLEIPMSRSMDVAFDIGYRSLAIGEERIAFGFSNLPSVRRIDMLRFRLGVTF
jgi:hypothetical protein